MIDERNTNISMYTVEFGVDQILVYWTFNKPNGDAHFQVDTVSDIHINTELVEKYSTGDFLMVQHIVTDGNDNLLGIITINIHISADKPDDITSINLVKPGRDNVTWLKR